VKYDDNTAEPVNAGTYTITADIAEGAVFAAATGLVLGTFTVEKAAPAVEDLDFSTDTVVWRSEQQGIDTPALKNSLTGLGEVTVKYDGRTRLPDEPGTYTVTVDIAEGTNYTDTTDLLLGTFTILIQNAPNLPARIVTLPFVPDASTNPPAGSYSLPSGGDFTFTLRPSSSLAGLAPSVTTGRASDAEGGVTCTPNADGSYTVVIRSVRQLLTVGIAFIPSDAVTVQGSSVWSSGGRLHIVVARPVEARILTLSGILVKTLRLAAGETVTDTLPSGIYIVVPDGIVGHKVFVGK
jgi:hypothetical protein